MEEYQKPEVLRQALRTVQETADKDRQKRERRYQDYAGAQSKVARNLSVQRSQRKHSKSMAGSLAEQTIEQRLMKDLNVTMDNVGLIPRTAKISPAREADFSRKFQILSQAMDDNLELSKQYHSLRDSMTKDQQTRQRQRKADLQRRADERQEFEQKLAASAAKA